MGNCQQVSKEAPKNPPVPPKQGDQKKSNKSTATSAPTTTANNSSNGNNSNNEKKKTETTDSSGPKPVSQNDNNTSQPLSSTTPLVTNNSGGNSSRPNNSIEAKTPSTPIVDSLPIEGVKVIDASYKDEPASARGTDGSKSSSNSNSDRKQSFKDISDPEERKLMAISKIQRQARRKSAMSAAKAEQQWKMFADLDTQDEAEMLHLAVFMQTLLDIVPGINKIDSGHLKRKLSCEEDGFKDLNEEDDVMISIDDINFNEKQVSSALNGSEGIDYSHRDIDMGFVADIISVFRKGGKLSKSTVMKILRRVYKILMKLPNTTYMAVPDRCKLTVIGDLHGQLSDLFHILDLSGLPSETNKFIFNGDFVDRGDKGLEICCTLFAMMVAAGPEIVCLNRGNHEDLPVCRVYGFENEVKEKYDELLFEMFAEVFNHLPLFAIVENSVFVVHGGLFHNPNVSMEDLLDINRTDYFVKPAIPYPKNIEGLGPEEAHYEYLKQLQRDALWSDPTDESGCYLNPRGAGITFGPDVTMTFMEKSDFCMVVRSHECCFRGFELPYSTALMQQSMYNIRFTGDEDFPLSDEPLLCTLFSASNYIGGDNEGAILQFMNHAHTGAYPVFRQHVNGKYSAADRHNLHYTVHRYKTSQANTKLDESNKTSLFELIMRKKVALNSAFEATDKDNSNMVTRLEWSEIMQKVTNIKILWLSMINTICPAEALTSKNHVDYRIFLNKFSLENRIGKDGQTSNVLDDMYGQRKQLESVFYFFDTNGDGVSNCLLF